MPALPNVAKVIRYDFIGLTSGGQQVRNRIFLQYSGTLSLADEATLANTALTAWATNLAPAISNDFTLTLIELTDLSSPSSPQTVKTVASAGTDVNAPMAAATAVVIKFKIARRYRGGHPRFYLGPLGSTHMSNSDQFTSAFLNSVSSDWTAFIAALVAAPPAAVGTLTHVNVSYFLGFTNKTFPSGRTKPVPTPRGTPVVDVVISYSVNPIAASQRRRNRQST